MDNENARLPLAQDVHSDSETDYEKKEREYREKHTVAVDNVPNTEPWKVLEPGKVFFNHGPTSMVVVADREGEPITDTIIAAFEVINNALTEVSASLQKLKRYPADINPDELSGIPLKMYEAVRLVGEPTLTPMATVAGAISDEVADWIFAKGATRVMVNNGGDVAIRLAPGYSVKIGIVTSLATGKMDRAVAIRAEDGIGGVATSGLGGRSLTRGIAQGVSAFSKSAILADGLATHLANCSFIESDAVAHMQAKHINPDTDIPELHVVLDVSGLTAKEAKQSLRQVKEEALRQKKKGNLIAMCARVENKMLDFQMPGA